VWIKLLEKVEGEIALLPAGLSTKSAHSCACLYTNPLPPDAKELALPNRLLDQ
jgi:hypothetical protein